MVGLLNGANKKYFSYRRLIDSLHDQLPYNKCILFDSDLVILVKSMSDTTNQSAGPSSGAFEASNRQIGTQAALVAGFAFAGLTVISYDPLTPRHLVSAFGIACATTIALELLALCGSGKLAIMGKRHQFGEDLNGNNLKAAYLNLFGLLAFVAAVNILVWIKFSWPVSLFVNIIFGLMLVVAAIWNSKLERLTDAHRDVGQKK